MKKIFKNTRTLSGFAIAEAALWIIFYSIGLADALGLIMIVPMNLALLAMMWGFRLMGKGLVHREPLAVWFYKLYQEAK